MKFHLSAASNGHVKGALRVCLFSVKPMTAQLHLSSPSLQKKLRHCLIPPRFVQSLGRFVKVNPISLVDNYRTYRTIITDFASILYTSSGGPSYY